MLHPSPSIGTSAKNARRPPPQEKNMGTVYVEMLAKTSEKNDDPKKLYAQFGE